MQFSKTIYPVIVLAGIFGLVLFVLLLCCDSQTSKHCMYFSLRSLYQVTGFTNLDRIVVNGMKRVLNYYIFCTVCILYLVYSGRFCFLIGGESIYYLMLLDLAMVI